MGKLIKLQPKPTPRKSKQIRPRKVTPEMRAVRARLASLDLAEVELTMLKILERGPMSGDRIGAVLLHMGYEIVPEMRLILRRLCRAGIIVDVGDDPDTQNIVFALSSATRRALEERATRMRRVAVTDEG